MVTAAACHENLVDAVTAFEDTNNGQTTQGGTQDTALARARARVEERPIPRGGRERASCSRDARLLRHSVDRGATP